MATLHIPFLMSIYSAENDTAIVGVFQVGIGITALAAPPVGTASVTYTDGFALAVFLTLVVTVIGTSAVVVGAAAN